MSLNNLLASPSFAGWMEGEPLDIQRIALHAGRQAAAVDHLDRASRRCRADVLRHDPAQRSAGLDAHAAGHDQPAGDAVHGRSLRLLSADRPIRRRSRRCSRCSKQARAFGLGVRAGDAEPGRPRLQGPVERRHVVPRPAANRARQGPRARRPGRRVGRRPARRSTASKWKPRWPAWATACS